MKSNPWEDISPKHKDINLPVEVIRKAFSGLNEFSLEKIGFDLDKVNFFPEEVTFDSPMGAFVIEPSWVPKVNPHPDFGYNPQDEKSREFFRYRLLLYPTSDYEIKYELFKFKYPILFYPVTLYVDSKSFNLLEKHIPEKGNLEAKNSTVLEDYITKIIRSESTIELISSLMAL